MDPFNEFDLRSFKTIEILGTSSEIKKHCIGWLISAKKGIQNYDEIIEFILKQFQKQKSSDFKSFDWELVGIDSFSDAKQTKIIRSHK